MRGFLLTVSIVLILAGCGSAPDQPGVEVNGAWMPVADLHLHTGAEFIESFETAVGAYSHEFDYPESLGNGLLV